MGKCTTFRTTGYFCKTRGICTDLAIRAGRQGFEAVVKSPLLPLKGPRPAWATPAMLRASKRNEGKWHVEIAYPLTRAGIARDAEVKALAERIRGVSWYFSEAGPFCARN